MGVPIMRGSGVPMMRRPLSIRPPNVNESATLREGIPLMRGHFSLSHLTCGPIGLLT